MERHVKERQQMRRTAAGSQNWWSLQIFQDCCWGAALRRGASRRNVAAVLPLDGIDWMLGLHLYLEECVW